MIRRWLAKRSEQELRNILSEEVMWPGAWYDRGHRCLTGAAAQAVDTTHLPACSVLRVEFCFDRLCHHFGNVRITRLIHEACLRELVRRGPSVPVPVLVLEEASV